MPLTHEEKAWDEFWKSAKETGVVNMLPIKLARSAFAAGYEAAQQSVDPTCPNCGAVGGGHRLDCIVLNLYL